MKCNGIIAFIGGALAGAAAALLLAPDSGENTRRRIRETARREYDNLKEKIREEGCNCQETPEEEM